MESFQPTPYPEVNDILCLLLKNVQEILSGQLIGMYLYGSLSSGDFDLETSDIDFLVVTQTCLPNETVAALEVMHNQIGTTILERAARLEGAYLPLSLLRRHDPQGEACPTVNEGRFYLATLGSDWLIQRHVVREGGVVVAGPDPKPLIDPVHPAELRTAVRGILLEWWFPMLEDPTWLRKHEPSYRAYAVISMCRALHALEHGTIVSKPKAIRWALEVLDDPWKQRVINRAVRVSQHQEPDVPLQETLDFIRYVQSTVESGGSLTPQTRPSGSSAESHPAQDSPSHRSGQ